MELSCQVYNYRPQTKLRKCNVFTSVCQEFWPQEGDVHPQADTTPQADNLWADPMGRHPPGQTPPGQTLPRQTPPPHQTATAADSTHPTGMHSCFFLSVVDSVGFCICRLYLRRMSTVGSGSWTGWEAGFRQSSWSYWMSAARATRVQETTRCRKPWRTWSEERK